VIDRMSFGLALAGVLMLGREWRSPSALWQGQAASPQAAAADPAALDSAAPSPWLQGDPADSLYRAAREALDRRDYAVASDLFAQVPTRFPRSGYAADSYYWRAFALYRAGGTGQLRTALQALDTQRTRYPKAATRGDARALTSRIEGELARRGDPAAAARVAQAAEAVSPPVPPVPPTAPAPPTPPTSPTPPTPPTPPSPGDRDDDESCGDDESDTKLAALSALQQMDDERARPILQRVLARRDAASACLRRKAVFLIAQQDAAGTEDILLQSVRSDPDREVREQAVFWLSQVGTDRAVGALDSILRTSKDAGIQEKALFALSQHGGDRAVKALRAYAERPDLSSDLREKAIFWIGQTGGADNEAFLRTLYGRLKEESLREKVLFSLSQAGGAENQRWLLGIAKDAKQPVELRKKALFWAGQSGASMADLASLYATMPDREMREQLIFVYSQRDEPAAVDKLLEIAKKDADPELRKKALFWLGQSDDPRAAKALQDIIEQP
jgi:HEAT repeat protein